MEKKKAEKRMRNIWRFTHSSELSRRGQLQQYLSIHRLPIAS